MRKILSIHKFMRLMIDFSIHFFYNVIHFFIPPIELHMTFVSFLFGKGLYKWCKITKMEDFVKGMFDFFKNYQKSEMLEMVIIDKSLVRFVQILKNK